METKKVLSIIFSIIFVGAFAFTLIWGITNFNKVKEGISGTGVYTKEDINNAYEDGYNTALTDKEEYTKLIASYRDTITSLNDKISQLNSQITNLTNNNKDYASQIEKLNNQTNELETQVEELTIIKANNEKTIEELNKKIQELQASITYYENYIASLENDNQVVATFEYDGSVYFIQTVSKGSNISAPTPTSTDYKIFNGWTVNGSLVDLDTYTISTNTTLIADITYKYDVRFMTDDTIYNTQIVASNGTITLPPNPTKSGYSFTGWSTNGVDVIEDMSTIKITENTTFYAVFGELKYKVIFMDGNSVYDTQTITKSNIITPPTNPTKKGYEFIGWTLKDSTSVIEDFSTFIIYEDTTLYALFNEIKYGLFADDGSVIYKWEELISNNYFSVENTKLYSGSNSDRVNLSGVIKIPNTILTIEDYTFYGCESLSEISLPSDLVSIGEYAFSGCKSLNYVVIPSTVTSIDKGAFNRCSNLKYIYIPSSVKTHSTTETSSHYVLCSIFDGCTNLTIYLEASSVPTDYCPYWNVISFDTVEYFSNLQICQRYENIVYAPIKTGYSLISFYKVVNRQTGTGEITL